MPILLPGCVLERLPNSKYPQQLPFVEVGPRPPLPRLGTLKRLRSELSDQLSVALRIPLQAVTSRKGPMRIDDELCANLDWSAGAAEALGAVAIRFETTLELTPSSRSRDLLAAYVQKLATLTDRQRVWTFSGLWEPADAYALAEQLGLICSFDPVTSTVPPGRFGYAYIKSLGARSRLSVDALRSVVTKLKLASQDTLYVALDSHNAFRQATLFRKLAEEPDLVTSDQILPG